ncbi:MAG TPA: glycosyltransferase family 2 protein [Acidimicrobiia bacterium]|nr:glycosyltransferase family 2 protein [Acidimicrobiia bacterium]
MAARWSAVVVNYESGAALCACVESLLADTSAGGPPDVVVVDNGSRDGSIARLERRCPAARVVDPGANVGYAGGANAGIAVTTTPVVAVCNPDLVVRPGTAAALIARFDDPGVAAAGPRIRNPDGSTYPSARSVPSHVDAVGHGLFGLLWPANPFSTRYRQLDADPSVARDVDWVSGAAIWLRRDALDAVGGWDDGYFMYVEDVDLCWRLGRAGWRIVYEPGGEVEHAQGLSTDAVPYRMIVEHHRSLLRFARKRWHGPKRVLVGPAAVYLAFRAVFAMCVRAARPRSGKPRVKG